MALTLAHICRMQIHSHSRTLIDTPSHTEAYTHTHTLSHSHTRPHTYIYAYAHLKCFHYYMHYAFETSAKMLAVILALSPQ